MTWLGYIKCTCLFWLAISARSEEVLDTHTHTHTQCRPANSVKALKAQMTLADIAIDITTYCSVVCLSVRHGHEPCQNRWTDWDAIWQADSCWPKEPCHVFMFYVSLLIVQLCFVSELWHFIDLFSCIAASLFNKLTYLLSTILWYDRLICAMAAIWAVATIAVATYLLRPFCPFLPASC